jgi:hypothetical protein
MGRQILFRNEPTVGDSLIRGLTSLADTGGSYRQKEASAGRARRLSVCRRRTESLLRISIVGSKENDGFASLSGRQCSVSKVSEIGTLIIRHTYLLLACYRFVVATSFDPNSAIYRKEKCHLDH